MSETFQTTEIGEFPETWKIDRVDSVFEIQQGKQVSKKNRVGDNQRPFLRTKNIFWNRLDLTNLDAMNFTESEESRFELWPNDLLTCEGGDIGRTALWNGGVERCYYQNHLHRLRAVNGRCDPQFSMYWFWYAFKIAELYFGRGNVTTIPNLSRSKLAELPMALPPLPEQKKIAHILSTVQRAIEAQEQIIQTTTELFKAMLHQLMTAQIRVSDGGSVEGNSEEDQRKSLVETDIGTIADDWRLVHLTEVADKPEYGLTAKAASEGSAKFLRITDITERGVNWDNVPFCSAEKKKIAKCRLEAGDIVFARIGATTGKSYLITDPPEAVFASYLIRVRAGDDLEPSFLIQFFQSQGYWQQIDANKYTNLKQGVNGSVLSKLLIPLPPLPEQKKIAHILSTIKQKADNAQSKKSKLQALFHTLLHELMTAKIRAS